MLSIMPTPLSIVLTHRRLYIKWWVSILIDFKLEVDLISSHTSDFFLCKFQFSIRSEERVLLEEASTHLVVYLYLGNRESTSTGRFKHSVCAM